ncbi:MAG: Ldh family oxidoreductase [Spirochaetia bacterium]
MFERYALIPSEELVMFCQKVLHACGVSQEFAYATADVLVAADARGIPSHGVSHLSRHLADLKSGLSQHDAQWECLSDFPSISLYDAHFGLGAPTSVFAMNKAIEKAKTQGVGVVSIKNSSHHGISGYYAMMAMQHGMIGLALTNTAALGTPTNGLEARFGTNPIAFAAPSGKETPFVLDMSTTVVTRGAIEICQKMGLPIPVGWAIDQGGECPHSAKDFLDNLLSFKGGLLPLGGDGVSHGGHKGYGLAVMVDILSGVLAGGNYGVHVHDTQDTAASVGHFFLALNIEAFRPLAGFCHDIDDLLNTLKTTKPKKGIERVVYAGILADEYQQLSKKEGVRVLPAVLKELLFIAQEYELSLTYKPINME